VKLIKAGMDSKSVMARFEAERQALALMDHPNIAKVLDGGLHEHRPFFVMELVKGVPITAYCDHCKLTPKERLELFVQVCQAIQHAHQKGIIHRDIKPSNVLIALYDDKPVVKVIDFGVAKATGGALTEHTIDTGFGGVVGTPQYMSPEQATFNNLDIDTRSDVYALGVLLYELLTGSPPFSKKEFEKRGLMEMLRVVREEEPPRPSTKLSTADALPSLSANRGTDPKKLTGLLRNELDWIVMKALEKDRTRRYETANGFAADVLRYLGGEAVQAHPPSTAYRLKKFVRRNKGQVIAASLVLFVLLAGMAGTTLGLIEARRQEGIARSEVEAKELARAAEAEQRGIAEANEKKAIASADAEAKQRGIAEANEKKAVASADAEKKAKEAAVTAAAAEKAAKEQAQKNLAFAKKGNELLGSVFAGLDPKRNYATLGEFSEALKANLKKAVQDLDGSAIGDPLEVAAMQNTLGLSLLRLGDPGQAIILFAKARATATAKLGADHADTLTSMNNLANGYGAAGKLDLALPLYEQTLKLRTAKLGADHPDTLTSMANLANGYGAAGKLDLALPLYEETWKLMKAVLGVDHPDTLTSMNNLASAYQAAGKLDLALPLLEETLRLRKSKLGADHPDTLVSMNNLAMGYTATGMRALALGLHEETWKLRKAKLGANHPDTLASMANLALGYQQAGKLDLALPLYEEDWKLMKAVLGVDHPDTLASMANLAQGYREARKLDLALPLLEENLKLRKAKLGAEHPHTLVSMNELANGYEAAGKLDLALPLREETLRLRKTKLGTEHPDTLVSMNDLAGGYQSAGKLDLALPLYEETWKLMKTKLGADHDRTLIIMANLAGGYKAAGKLDLALPLYEETWKLMKAKLGADHPTTLITLGNLGKAYSAAGRGVEAAEVLEPFVAEQRKRYPANSPGFGDLLAQVASDLLQCRQYAAAEGILRECLAIREKQEPDDWRTFNTQSMLGAALLGQKKYADAEPLLLKGYEGMKQREKTIPKVPQTATRIPEALDRLVAFYTAANKPDEVKKWQAERAKYKELAPPARPLIK